MSFKKFITHTYFQITLCCCILFISNAAFATNYYIDNITGSDANPGTLAAPWKNITFLNSKTFLPGSKIFLKAGSTWTGQQLKFNGSGTMLSVISIDRYGIGANPILDGHGLTGEGVIYLFNQQYIEISNLEITNAPNGPVDGDFFAGIYGTNPLDGDFFVGIYGSNPLGGDRRGVMVAIDKYGTCNHIYLRKLNIHHIKGELGSSSTQSNGAYPKRTGGIYFDVLGNTENTSSKSRFNDILIDSCQVNYCENLGIAFDNEWNVYYPGGQSSTIPADVTEYNNWYDRRFSNIKISNNIIHHIGKNAMIIRCFDSTGLIEHNICYQTAKGTTGNTMFTARCKGTVFQYNEGYENCAGSQTLEPGNIDGSMYDPDLGSVGVIFQYSYSHNNTHGLYWGCNSRTLGLTTPDPGDVGCIARYNISQNDSGNLVYFNYASAGNEIYNNVFYIDPSLSPNIIKENSSKEHTYDFFNNIVYNPSATNSKYSFTSTGQTRTIEHNVFYGYHPSSEPTDPYLLTSNPLFVNPGSGSIGINTLNGYKLNPASPAINSGRIIPNNGGLDFFNNAVSPTSIPSRGACQCFSAILPVTYTGFSVAAHSSKVYIQWTVSGSLNIENYMIERSSDGIHFSPIYIQTANNNTGNAQAFDYIDQHPFTGINYYRIRSVDAAGIYSYSQVKSIYFKSTSNYFILTNPVADILHIRTVERSEVTATITIINAAGAVVQTNIQINGSADIDVRSLATGIYTVLIKDEKRGNIISGLSMLKM